MFERFTDRARRVVVLSQEEARRLQHDYIGTEHLLLGLLSEQEGVAGRALRQLGISHEQVREEVIATIGRGTETRSGHIPFTPRAKKVLELSLREAVGLGHNYIGTEHILLGLVREGDGVAAKVLVKYTDLSSVRRSVIEQLQGYQPRRGRRRAWARRGAPGETFGALAAESHLEMSASPAADVTLSEAARLAGAQPVGSHHLLLAALTDPDSAAARALGTLGIDLDQARTALRDVDITGTTDEAPEEAGRRAMTIRIDGERVIVELADPAILDATNAALRALGEETVIISGTESSTASLSIAWQALRDSLDAIQRAATATDPAEGADGADSGAAKPDKGTAASA